MQYVFLGKTGLQVSRICLGCMSYGSSRWRDWVLDYDAALPFFKQAHEAGVNYYDTADMYSDGASEEVLGRALKELAMPREQVVVASKLFNPTGRTPNERGTARKHVRHAIENTLRRLGTDYVDLYQIHRFDRGTPVEETLDALGQLVDEGKVLYLGASSMAAWEFARFLYKADLGGFRRFVCMQNHYNLVYREEEREMIPLCREEGIGLIPWSPLARGFLAGNRDKSSQGETTRAKSDDFAHKMYYEDSDFEVVDRVVAVGQEMARLRRRWRWRGCCKNRRSPRPSSERRRRIIWTMPSRRWNCGFRPSRSSVWRNRTGRIRCWVSPRNPNGEQNLSTDYADLHRFSEGKRDELTSFLPPFNLCKSA